MQNVTIVCAILDSSLHSPIITYINLDLYGTQVSYGVYSKSRYPLSSLASYMSVIITSRQSSIQYVIRDISSTMPPIWHKFHARRVDLARRVDAAWICRYKFSPPVGFTRFSLPPVSTNTRVPRMTSLSRTQIRHEVT